MNKKKYVTVVVVCLAIVGAVALSYGFAPVLKVNGRTFTYAEFSKMEHTIGKFNATSGKEPVKGPELRAHAFMNLIEQAFLDAAIDKTDTALYERADDNVAMAIAQNNDPAKLTEAIDRLYGLSTKDFKKLILLPQAKKDVILKHYETDNAGLQKVWDEVRTGATIKVYYPGFYWDGELIKQK